SDTDGGPSDHQVLAVGDDPGFGLDQERNERTNERTNEQARIRDERRGMVMVSYRVRKSVAVNIGRKNAAAGKRE
ncbi:hypothetical protein, partial [Azotobacter vinelandii]|uniref:hypothetical protein n=1 Tax=Azotobacter vinelandii TaxID=354 RepID=UPI001C31CC4F